MFFELIGGGTSWEVKYRDSVTSIFANHEKPQKQNNGWLGLFSLTGNHIIPCFEKWLGYSREGNSKRSSINKVIFEYQDNKKIDHLKIREIPENNFFALEFLRRESFKNSLLAIPKSFYETNKDYLTNLGFQFTGLNTTQKRDLKFEIEKKEIENKHKKRSWINGLLANYNNFEKNFHLERTATYYDQNWQCIKERSYGDSVHELHEVTGSEHGVDERSVAKCEDQPEEKAKKNK